MQAPVGVTLKDRMTRAAREGDLVIDIVTGRVGHVAIDLSDLDKEPWLFLDFGPGDEDLYGVRPQDVKVVTPLEALASAGV